MYVITFGKGKKSFILVVHSEADGKATQDKLVFSTFQAQQIMVLLQAYIQQALGNKAAKTDKL